MANGKAKGSSFERDLAKLFTLWLTGQKKEYYFWRSPGSGAVSTVSAMNADISGDIIALKPEAQFFTDFFSIEAKNGYPEGSLDKILKKNKDEIIEQFWDQATADANRGKKNPLLIYKKKGFKTPWLGISKEVYDVFKDLLNNIRFIHVNFVNKDLKELYLFNIDEFLEKVHPNILKERIKI